MPIEQNTQEYPGNPIGFANIPTQEPPDTIVINLSPNMPESAHNGDGCVFAMFAPLFWLIGRRNKLSPPTNFED